MVWRLALLSLLLAVLAACGDSQDTATTPEGTPGFPPTPTGEAEPPALTPPVTASPNEALAPVIAARQALAALSGRTLKEVEVVSVAPKQWPDACLGVPTNRELCATVITPGYEVVLSLDDNIFTYHTDERTNVRPAITVQP